MFNADIVNLFLKRLVELRTQKGVSSRDMSLSLGQNPNYINKIENGLSLPSMTGFFNICEYFDVSPPEFFNGKDNNPTLSSEIVKSIQSLNEDEAKLIVDMIKALDKYKK